MVGWLPSRTERQQPENTESHSATRKAKQQASLKPKEQTECYWDTRIALEKVRQSHSLVWGRTGLQLEGGGGGQEEQQRKTVLGFMEGEGFGSLQAFKNSEDKYLSKMMLCMQLLLAMGREHSRHSVLLLFLKKVQECITIRY